MYFFDYAWKEGKPIGIKKLSNSSIKETKEPIYKIVSDPYGKRISVEEYSQGTFLRTIYDSAFLNFKHLSEKSQLAWQSERFFEDTTVTKCLIRDQDDRVVFLEEHFFKEGLCIKCQLLSPQKTLLSEHCMFYTKFNDPFNGVLLLDSSGRPVLLKKYLFNEELLAFSELLEEKKDFLTLKQENYPTLNISKLM